MLSEKRTKDFWSNVQIKQPDECWLWQLSTRRFGHGRFKVGGRLPGAHRLAYELTKGPIPPGMLVCHSCDVPACCNPAHLWVGTHADNNRDCNAKGRRNPASQKGELNNKAKLVASQVAYIKRLIAAGYDNTQIAAWYGVTHSTISLIRLGKTWQSIVANDNVRETCGPGDETQVA